MLSSKWLKQVDLADLYSKDLVVCCRVRKPKGTSDPAPKAKITGLSRQGDEAESDKTSKLLPTDKTLAENLWAAYGVKRADTFVVTDKLGNEYKRSKSQKLAKVVTKLKKDAKSLQKKLKKCNVKALKALKKSDLKTACKEILRVFKADKFGWAETDKAAELYEDLLTKGRAQLEASSGDKVKLKALAKALKGSDLADDVAVALKGLS